jgi:hypothetical protein
VTIHLGQSQGVVPDLEPQPGQAAGGAAAAVAEPPQRTDAAQGAIIDADAALDGQAVGEGRNLVGPAAGIDLTPPRTIPAEEQVHGAAGSPPAEAAQDQQGGSVLVGDPFRGVVAPGLEVPQDGAQAVTVGTQQDDAAADAVLAAGPLLYLPVQPPAAGGVAEEAGLFDRAALIQSKVQTGVAQGVGIDPEGRGLAVRRQPGLQALAVGVVGRIGPVGLVRWASANRTSIDGCCGATASRNRTAGAAANIMGVPPTRTVRVRGGRSSDAF